MASTLDTWSDHQLKEWMKKANLSTFTVRLKQNGIFSLRDMASSRQCGTETFLKSLGMNKSQMAVFGELRNAACEALNLHPGRDSKSTSDIVDITKPLSATFDREMKIVSVGADSQVSPEELGRRVISVGGIIVQNTKEFKEILQLCRANSSICELVYGEVPKVSKAPPPPPKVLTKRLSVTEREELELQAAIEASKAAAQQPPPPPIPDQEDDEDEALRKAIEASKLDSTPQKSEESEEEKILAAAISASTQEAREAEFKKREEELLKKEEELALRAALAESEVHDVRGRLASTDMTQSRISITSGAVLVEGTEVYHIPKSALKLEPEPFARGGGGQIFKGKYTGNAIAAKQVFSNMNEDDRAEFDSEVATLTRLSHPCIMNCYGILEDTEKGDLFMILEYCGGGDLDSFYQTEEFTKREFIRVVGELLSGISYIHARSMAHRDLKPANVLLEAGTRKVKIADFGLAKSSHTTVQRGIGTPNYMPPEMLVDDDEPTNMLAVDVYAIGIIMWQLWFRSVPFSGKSVHKILSSVCKGKRPSLDHDPEDPLPLSLAALVQECWSQEQEDRPSVDTIFATFDEQISPTIEDDIEADLRTTDHGQNGTPSGGGGGIDPIQSVF